MLSETDLNIELVCEILSIVFCFSCFLHFSSVCRRRHVFVCWLSIIVETKYSSLSHSLSLSLSLFLLSISLLLLLLQVQRFPSHLVLLR